MNPSIRQKLEQLAVRYATVQSLLADPSVTEKMDEYVKLGRENTELQPVIDLFGRYQQIEKDLVTAEAMLADPEMRELAEEELEMGRTQLADAEAELQRLLLPKDPNDDGNIILEVRAGTGGDESALFAGDLFRMYSRFAERNRWQVEIISESLGEVGGYKEIIARIEGHGAYSRLKFESGGHRVQRVPATETQGRIHTSAATVAIMAEVEEGGDININPADVRVDTFRASGAGGQHINKTDSAVRLTHIPTGIVVECQDGRSQHKNKAQAFRVLASRIKDKELREAQAKQASERRSLIGSGDRSDRIRTYNFPQGRVTDHRINLTLYKIADVMDGDLGEVIGALAAEHQADQLAQLAEQV